MNSEYYDIAQICLNGHIINTRSVSLPEDNQDFCDKCGKTTITACQNCNIPIRGDRSLSPHSWMGVTGSEVGYSRPAFCSKGCGKPYPWTEAGLRAAQELADELDKLNEEERDTLKKSLDDIVRDTPHATVAATRFKKLVAKAGRGAAEGFKNILVDIISETAKKMIWP